MFSLIVMCTILGASRAQVDTAVLNYVQQNPTKLTNVKAHPMVCNQCFFGDGTWRKLSCSAGGSQAINYLDQCSDSSCKNCKIQMTSPPPGVSSLVQTCDGVLQYQRWASSTTCTGTVTQTFYIPNSKCYTSTDPDLMLRSQFHNCSADGCFTTKCEPFGLGCKCQSPTTVQTIPKQFIGTCVKGDDGSSAMYTYNASSTPCAQLLMTPVDAPVSGVVSIVPSPAAGVSEKLKHCSDNKCTNCTEVATISPQSTGTCVTGDFAGGLKSVNLKFTGPIDGTCIDSAVYQGTTCQGPSIMTSTSVVGVSKYEPPMMWQFISMPPKGNLSYYGSCTQSANASSVGNCEVTMSFPLGSGCNINAATGSSFVATKVYPCQYTIQYLYASSDCTMPVAWNLHINEVCNPADSYYYKFEKFTPATVAPTSSPMNPTISPSTAPSSLVSTGTKAFPSVVVALSVLILLAFM